MLREPLHPLCVQPAQIVDAGVVLRLLPSHLCLQLAQAVDGGVVLHQPPCHLRVQPPQVGNAGAVLCHLPSHLCVKLAQIVDAGVVLREPPGHLLVQLVQVGYAGGVLRHLPSHLCVQLVQVVDGGVVLPQPLSHLLNVQLVARLELRQRLPAAPHLLHLRAQGAQHVPLDDLAVVPLCPQRLDGAPQGQQVPAEVLLLLVRQLGARDLVTDIQVPELLEEDLLALELRRQRLDCPGLLLQPHINLRRRPIQLEDPLLHLVHDGGFDAARALKLLEGVPEVLVLGVHLLLMLGGGAELHPQEVDLPPERRELVHDQLRELGLQGLRALRERLPHLVQLVIEPPADGRLELGQVTEDLRVPLLSPGQLGNLDCELLELRRARQAAGVQPGGRRVDLRVSAGRAGRPLPEDGLKLRLGELAVAVRVEHGGAEGPRLQLHGGDHRRGGSHHRDAGLRDPSLRLRDVDLLRGDRGRQRG
mmetsp:Transcript_13260/g.42375  ORF Transcript_13260/g.42375 Transcript_13260/m.42375 type:complete len:475 (+) Transcript_13260:874-2298(+)